MKRLTKVTAALAAAGLAVAGAGILAPTAAYAVDDISGTITPGSFTSTLSTASFGSIPYSFSSSGQTASTTLSVSDLTGDADGWDVKVAASSLTAVGTSDTIPNTGLTFSSVATPVLVAGEDIDVTNGPLRSGTSTGSLDTSRSLLEAQATYGEGSYTQALTLGVQVPAQLDAGTYTGTFTVTRIAPTP